MHMCMHMHMCMCMCTGRLSVISLGSENDGEPKTRCPVCSLLGMRTTCISLAEGARPEAADSPPAPPTAASESGPDGCSDNTRKRTRPTEPCVGRVTSATIEVLLRHNQISSMSVEAAMVAAIDSAYRKLPHAFGQMTPQRIMGLPVAQAVPISLIPLPLSAAPLLQTTKAMPPPPSPPLSPPMSVPTAAASRSPFKRRRTSPSDDDLTPLTAEERYRARLLLAEKEGRLPDLLVAWLAS